MRKVILYGELANRYGREHTLAVNNAAEAIQAFCANFPGFRDLITSAHRYGIGFKMFVGKQNLQRAKDSLLPCSEADVIRIVPAIFGSGGWVKTLIGAALVVVGVVFTPFSAGFSNALTAAGLGLILNGVFQLLTAPPPGASGDSSSDDVNGQSFVFSGPENVTQQGGAVPVGYGRMMVGSTVISAGIEDQDA